MTAREAQQVLDNGFRPRRNVRGSPDTRLLIGRTDGGRSVTLVARHLGDGTWLTFTAWETKEADLRRMEMERKKERSALTAAEKNLVGAPGDLVSEDSVPRRARSGTVMVSLRIERQVSDELSHVAEARGRTFSETARDALRTYVSADAAGSAYPLAEHGLARPGRKVSENAVPITWTDDDLRGALDRYEAACREAAMRDNAWRSYVDYARRFLAWRTGDYQPRGSAQPIGPCPERRHRPSSSVTRRPGTLKWLRMLAAHSPPSTRTYVTRCSSFDGSRASFTLASAYSVCDEGWVAASVAELGLLLPRSERVRVSRRGRAVAAIVPMPRVVCASKSRIESITALSDELPAGPEVRVRVTLRNQEGDLGVPKARVEGLTQGNVPVELNGEILGPFVRPPATACERHSLLRCTGSSCRG